MKLPFLSLPHTKLHSEGILEFKNNFTIIKAAILAKKLISKNILKHAIVLYTVNCVLTLDNFLST